MSVRVVLRKCVVPSCPLRYREDGTGTFSTVIAGKLVATGLCACCAAYYWLCSDCGALVPRHSLRACLVDAGYRCAGCLRTHAAAAPEHQHREPQAWVLDRRARYGQA